MRLGLPNFLDYHEPVTAPTSPVAAPEPRDLATLEVGSTCIVGKVGLAPSDRLRLAEIGIRPGVTLTVLGRTSGGGRLLAFGTSRVALDRETAQHITAVDDPGGRR